VSLQDDWDILQPKASGWLRLHGTFVIDPGDYPLDQSPRPHHWSIHLPVEPPVAESVVTGYEIRDERQSEPFYIRAIAPVTIRRRLFLLIKWRPDGGRPHVDFFPDQDESAQLKLYLLQWDEPIPLNVPNDTFLCGALAQAYTERQARKVAAENSLSEGDVWLDPSRTRCFEVGVATDQTSSVGILLRDVRDL